MGHNQEALDIIVISIDTAPYRPPETEKSVASGVIIGESELGFGGGMMRRTPKMPNTDKYYPSTATTIGGV